MSIIMRVAAAACCALAMGAEGHAGELLTNGDFATGDLTGWTLFTTAKGDLGISPAPQVVEYDTSGFGSPSFAAQFQVGSLDGFQQDGGGLRQSFFAPGGTVSFSAYVATATSQLDNAAAGIFSVLLDGQVLASHNFATIRENTIERALLSFTGNVNVGQHTLEILITRNYLNGSFYGNTPLQYVDHVTLATGVVARPNDPTAEVGPPIIQPPPPGGVPEPSTWATMILGFGMAGASVRKLRRRDRAAVAG